MFISVNRDIHIDSKLKVYRGHDFARNYAFKHTHTHNPHGTFKLRNIHQHHKKESQLSKSFVTLKTQVSTLYGKLLGQR